MHRREKVLYPVKVAAILVLASIAIYVAFSAIPIVYSVYVAFTDANAKNVAPGPRLEELLKSRDRIVKHLTENRDLIIRASKEASLVLEDALETIVSLREYLEKAAPETLSIVKIRSFKGDFDSKILKAKDIILSNETPLYLNPGIRDPLDRALRILDYKVWQALEASLLLKVVITEKDIEVMRSEVIPSLDSSIEDLRVAYESLRSVERDYEGFVSASILELNRQIDELTLHFTGLDNFRKLFGDSRFPYSILKTLLFVSTSVPLKVFVGVMLAWVFSSELIYGRRILRGLLLLPWAIPVLLSITTWRMLF
ncbi:MAG: hypothetical protein P3X22_003590, partial [Thermoprotei archaeon]|nr:hypothetical protein [Thermoprotei archaeon]